MVKPLISTEGLEQSKNIALMLDVFKSGAVSGDYVGSARSGEDVSNAEIVEYLAEGNSRSDNPIKRDIRPNQTEIAKAADIFADEMTTQLKQVGRQVKGAVITVEKQGAAGMVKGAKKVIQYLAKQMIDRLQSGTTNTGSPAQQVGKAYAAQRENKHGVNEGVVFVASGQLADDFLNGTAKVKFNKGALGKALQSIKK